MFSVVYWFQPEGIKSSYGIRVAVGVSTGVAVRKGVEVGCNVEVGLGEGKMDNPVPLELLTRKTPPSNVPHTISDKHPRIASCKTVIPK